MNWRSTSSSKRGAVTDVVGNQGLVLIAKQGAVPSVTDMREPSARPVDRRRPVGDVRSRQPSGRAHGEGEPHRAGIVERERKEGGAGREPAARGQDGRADAPFAIVFTTDALTDPGVEIVATLPEDSHPPIRYPVAILAKSANPDTARFLDYLLSPAAGDIFRRDGYVTPAKK